MKKYFIHLIIILISCLFSNLLQAQVTAEDCDIDQKQYNSATGYRTKATGKFSFASGYRVKALADNSFIFGTRATGTLFDSINDISSNNTKNSFLVLFQSKPVFFARLAPFSATGELLDDEQEGGDTGDTTQFKAMVGIGTAEPAATLHVSGDIITKEITTGTATADSLIVKKIVLPEKTLTFNYYTTPLGNGEVDEEGPNSPNYSPPGNNENDSIPDPLQSGNNNGSTSKIRTPFSINENSVTIGANIEADLNVNGNTYLNGNVKAGIASYNIFQVAGNSYFSEKVGIGTVNPSQKLHVSGNSYFSDSVGIGIANPKYKFHVSGDSYFTENVRIGTSNVKALHFGQTAYNEAFGYGISYIGFNASRNADNETWTLQSDDANNGGGIIWNTIGGNMYFATIPVSENGAVDQTLTDTIVKNNVKLILKNNGNFGIGTTTPSQKLHVAGNACISDSIAIGVSKPSDKLHLNGNSYFTGNMGIGIKNSGDYKLKVKGKINCEEVVITANIKGDDNNWPDYVFNDDYNLPDLDEVSAFIKQNRHLPEIPTAAEVSENGISLGTMNTLLLKKVEELTLYILQQNERMMDMQKQINELKIKN